MGSVHTVSPRGCKELDITDFHSYPTLLLLLFALKKTINYFYSNLNYICQHLNIEITHKSGFLSFHEKPEDLVTPGS